MSLTKHPLAIGRVASGNHKASANDEPERDFATIEREAQAEARAILRANLTRAVQERAERRGLSA